ncbi:hypothetical protein IV203_030243 [Nitzschia inconspicua]|uniref:Uncharacterized protein n=1 Tax=Nitzschia inconspicua TaxID=303405 RepID=A0A9K3Q139_9STRA|nr:hypothetical protein IV203_030243 [Nitzschia inconspicua]
MDKMWKQNWLALFVIILGVLMVGISQAQSLSDYGESVLTDDGERDEGLDYEYLLPKRRLGSSLQDYDDMDKFWDDFAKEHANQRILKSSKSTKAPSVSSKSTKAPTMKSTKAPSSKSTKVPSTDTTEESANIVPAACRSKSAKSNIFC